MAKGKGSGGPSKRELGHEGGGIPRGWASAYALPKRPHGGPATLYAAEHYIHEYRVQATAYSMALDALVQKQAPLRSLLLAGPSATQGHGLVVDAQGEDEDEHLPSPDSSLPLPSSRIQPTSAFYEEARRLLARATAFEVPASTGSEPGPGSKPSKSRALVRQRSAMEDSQRDLGDPHTYQPAWPEDWQVPGYDAPDPMQVGAAPERELQLDAGACLGLDTGTARLAHIRPLPNGLELAVKRPRLDLQQVHEAEDHVVPVHDAALGDPELRATDSTASTIWQSYEGPRGPPTLPPAPGMPLAGATTEPRHTPTTARYDEVARTGSLFLKSPSFLIHQAWEGAHRTPMDQELPGFELELEAGACDGMDWIVEEEQDA